MNREPTKRPWFQIHLSTAIVLMFVAGIIIWRNVENHRMVSWKEWGWPEPVYYSPGPEHTSAGGIYEGPFPQEEYILWNTINWTGLVINVLTALFLILGTAIASEFCVRRRLFRRGLAWKT